MKCPKCGEELEATFNKYQDESADYVEVELRCKNDHLYFTRIKEEDLCEA